MTAGRTSNRQMLVMGFVAFLLAVLAALWLVGVVLS